MSFSYQTSRLQISEIFNSKQEPDFLISVVGVLTPKVVENLPPYFQNINSIASGQKWLEQIISDGRLFIVKLADESHLIGFVFLSSENASGAHIGYLLGESYWGNGYATEILKGLIDFIELEGKITHLIAGVATDNEASIKLLHKLGFNKNSNEGNGTMFFEYMLSQKDEAVQTRQ